MTETFNINSKSEITKRLLKSLSVKSFKDIFELGEYKERQTELINFIVTKNTENIIYEKLFDNFSLLKQHIYVFEAKGTFPNDWLENHPNIISIKKVTTSHNIYNLLYLANYKYYNVTKSIAEEIQFELPVQIHRKGTKFILHINILERDLTSLIKDKLLKTSKDLNDDYIIDDIIKFLPLTVNLVKIDLNKGIKKIWHDDEVDACKVKYKKANSTSSEVMDEDFLLKAKYPETYNELIKAPLSQTTFRILEKTNLVQYFIVEPTKGTFSFTIYPQNHNGVNDLIDIVLNHN